MVAITIAGAWTQRNTGLLSLAIWARGTNAGVVANLLACPSFQQSEPGSEGGGTVMTKILEKIVAAALVRVMEMEAGSLPGAGKRGDVE